MDSCMRAHATVQKPLCRGSYCEFILSLARALCRLSLPPAPLPARRNQSPDAVRSRNPSKSTLAHDTVPAAVLHKHHPTICVGAGLIQFVYRSHWRLATEEKSIFAMFARFFPLNPNHQTKFGGEDKSRRTRALFFLSFLGGEYPTQSQDSVDGHSDDPINHRRAPLISFFLSWVLNTQLNHLTRRVVLSGLMTDFFLSFFLGQRRANPSISFFLSLFLSFFLFSFFLLSC